MRNHRHHPYAAPGNHGSRDDVRQAPRPSRLQLLSITGLILAHLLNRVETPAG
jgi:hypothetical protein